MEINSSVLVGGGGLEMLFSGPESRLQSMFDFRKLFQVSPYDQCTFPRVLYFDQKFKLLECKRKTKEERKGDKEPSVSETHM